ncbi:MAG: YIP1 family protein [Chloroflexi bacterium]|nr:YIP1 family protein [Chloroflexota bacterium]
MTETSTALPPKKRLDFSKVMALFLRPRQVFESIAANGRPTWQTPLLILSVTALLVVLVGGYFNARAAQMGTSTLPADFEYWTPEMQQNYFSAQQAMSGPTFVYVIPLAGAWISLWLGWLALGGLMHLASTLLGGRGSMSSALHVAAWASLPFALRDVLRIVFMLVTQRAISTPGLAGFAADGSAFLTQVLTHADLFLVWQALLLMMGFFLADNLSKNKAILGVLIVLILILLAWSGLGTLGASLGGTAIQRPFF